MRHLLRTALLLSAVTALPLSAQEIGLAPAHFADIAATAAQRAPAAQVGPTADGFHLGLSQPSLRWNDLAIGTLGQDTIAPWKREPKKFGLAVAEIGMIWVVPWFVNRYIMDETWANVGPDVWWKNLTNPWVFDEDHFVTNQFAHPYHGSFYYNSARSNGYDFWASSGFAAFGAWGWEIFGEDNPPAINDLISTSVGGIAVGEASYRLAQMVTDNTATGAERTWREIAGFFVAPMVGFNRLIRGDMSRRFENPPGRMPSRFALIASGGGQAVRSDIPNDLGVQETGQVVASVEMVYGNPFVDTIIKPFSTFRAVIDIASNNDFVIQRLNYEGTLFGTRRSSETEQGSHFFMATQRYLYFKNPAFEFGGVALNGKYGKIFVHSNKWATMVETGPGWVMLGAVPSTIHYEEGRDYDFTTGAAMMLEGSLMYRGRPLLRLGGTSSYLFTIDGAADSHLLNVGTATVNLPVRKNLSAGLMWLGFWRNSYYGDSEDNGKSSQVRAYLSMAFGYSDHPMVPQRRN